MCPGSHPRSACILICITAKDRDQERHKAVTLCGLRVLRGEPICLLGFVATQPNLRVRDESGYSICEQPQRVRSARVRKTKTENRPRSLSSAAGSDSPRITPSSVPVFDLLLIDVRCSDVHASLGQAFLMIIDPDFVSGIPGTVGHVEILIGKRKGDQDLLSA